MTRLLRRITSVNPSVFFFADAKKNPAPFTQGSRAGLRIQRTNGSKTYSYIYTGSTLTQMTVGSDTLYFTYDASGIPLTVTHNGTTYYYATNLQGDIVAILDANGATVVTYTYDAWGKPLTTTGTMAATLGAVNPLRYRGYVYDTESELYYLQSRYYNPEIGRFINADILLATGQGFIENNMFAYCLNNPVLMKDPTGCLPNFEPIVLGIEKVVDCVNEYIVEPACSFDRDISEDILNFDIFNDSEQKVLDSNYFSFYKGVLTFRTNGNRSGSFGIMFITRETNMRSNPEDIVRHEYGHTVQLEQLGLLNYALCIMLPSWKEWGSNPDYYSRPWEITADIFGNVQSRNHRSGDIQSGLLYLWDSSILGPLIWMFIE